MVKLIHPIARVSVSKYSLSDIIALFIGRLLALIFILLLCLISSILLFFIFKICVYFFSNIARLIFLIANLVFIFIMAFQYSIKKRNKMHSNFIISYRGDFGDDSYYREPMLQRIA